MISDVPLEMIEKRMAGDPSACVLVREKWKLMPDFFHGVFVQRSQDKPITLAEKYLALQCYSALERGALWFAAAEVPSGPLPDADIEGNNAILAQLPEPFSATFAPGDGTIAGWCDGALTWEGEHLGFVADERVPLDLGGSGIALEAGTTSASKSFLYLFGSAGLARWPYGSSLIYIFYRNFDHPSWEKYDNR